MLPADAPATDTPVGAPADAPAADTTQVNTTQVNTTQVKTGPRFVVVLVSVVLLLQVASLATIGVTLHESERRSDEIAALASKVEIAALSSKVDETARSISADVEAQIRLDRPTVGPISSVRPSNKSRPHVIMAMDIDYPPYAYTRETHPGPPFSDTHALDEVVGVGADMIKALGEHCGFDVTITQAHWSDCWAAGEIGAGLREGLVPRLHDVYARRRHAQPLPGLHRIVGGTEQAGRPHHAPRQQRSPPHQRQRRPGGADHRRRPPPPTHPHPHPHPTLDPDSDPRPTFTLRRIVVRLLSSSPPPRRTRLPAGRRRRTRSTL